jgi:hypothetical protein
MTCRQLNTAAWARLSGSTFEVVLFMVPLSGGVNMTLREELLKIQEEVCAKYAKQKEKEAA